MDIPHKLNKLEKVTIVDKQKLEDVQLEGLLLAVWINLKNPHGDYFI